MKKTFYKKVIIALMIVWCMSTLGCSSEKRTEHLFEQAASKIWIVDVEDYVWNTPCSFSIDRVEDGRIEGCFATREIAVPEFCYYSFSSPSKYIGSLKGVISGDKAECEFKDDAGNEGYVTLSFTENGEIQGSVIYEKKSEIDEDYFLDGTYNFRPYNLSDETGRKLECEKKYDVELNSWGNVFFVTEQFDYGDRTLPEAYLINSNNDILYVFSAPYIVGTEAGEVFFEDINGDGLLDIKMYTPFIGAGDMEKLEWIFFQCDDGTFCGEYWLENGAC